MSLWQREQAFAGLASDGVTLVLRQGRAVLHTASLLPETEGVGAAALALDALITPLLDRPMAEISPVEHAVMWIGTYEMQNCPDVPWRVVINECVELAKEFGGTDGHKYVNGVLNGLAPTLRALEVEADRAKKPRA